MQRFHVGVDVVDLTDPRTEEKSRDERFLRRVFTDRERTRIEGAADPDVELWTLWAAKEAAFKVVSKLAVKRAGDPPVFRHAAFEVLGPPGSPVRVLEWEGSPFGLGVDVGEARERVMVWSWDGTAPQILVARATVEEAIAVLGVTQEVEAWQAERLRPEELDAVHGLNSALVRVMAKRDAAQMLELDPESVAIICPAGPTGLRPPFLHQGPEPIEAADVSLSHDGRELAWAIRFG